MGGLQGGSVEDTSEGRQRGILALALVISTQDPVFWLSVVEGRLSPG